MRLREVEPGVQVHAHKREERVVDCVPTEGRHVRRIEQKVEGKAGHTPSEHASPLEDRDNQG